MSKWSNGSPRFGAEKLVVRAANMTKHPQPAIRILVGVTTASASESTVLELILEERVLKVPAAPK